MADLSLDTIIQQRKFRMGRQQGIRVNEGGGGRNWINMKDRLNKPQGFGDVRNKIIQKKRLKMRDARDRLAEIAKQGDARERINKMRKKTAIKKSPVGRISEKIHNENKPSQLMRKTQMKGTSLIRTVAGEMKPASTLLRRQAPSKTGWQPSTQKTINTSGRYHPIPNNPHVVTIKNDKAEIPKPYNPIVNRAAPRPQAVRIAARSTGAGRTPLPRAGGLISPSASREMSGMRSAGMMMRSSQQMMHLARRSPDLGEIRPTRLEITTANNYREPSPPYSDEWDLPSRHAPPPPSRPLMPRQLPSRLPNSDIDGMNLRSPARKRPIYDEKQLEMMRYSKKVAAISHGLMARLDQQAQRPTQVQGTKVLVTNLHPCVSVEDMEELFGTIGTIISARMVREGEAEAVFRNEGDAYRSVEVFNNRQLDGQPMCVSVVTKKVTPVPFAPPPQLPRTETRSILKAARGRTGYYI